MAMTPERHDQASDSHAARQLKCRERSDLPDQVLWRAVQPFVVHSNRIRRMALGSCRARTTPIQYDRFAGPGHPIARVRAPDTMNPSCSCWPSGIWSARPPWRHASCREKVAQSRDDRSRGCLGRGPRGPARRAGRSARQPSTRASPGDPSRRAQSLLAAASRHRRSQAPATAR